MNRQGLLRLGMLACAVVLTVACGEKKPGTNHSISESKPELVTLNPVQTVAFTLRIALPPADALDKTPIPPEQPSPDDKATLDAFIKEIVKGACGAADSIAFNSEHGGPIVLSIRLFRQALRPEVSEKDIAASSDQMHNLATQTRLSSITYNAIYLEGMTAKNPTSLPQATLDWGLANGLSSTAIVNAYLNGARRTYSKVNGCRTFMVEPAAANRTNVFVEQLYEANRDFIKKLKGYDTPSPSPTKGEFETTEDFERRKTKESAEYEKHKIVLDKDRSPIAQTVVSQSLSDHLTPFEIKDLVYNADKQMFNGSVLSADGSVKIPIEIYSNAEQAPKDKEELKSGAKITNQFHLEADGELVFDDFFIETKSVRFGAKTEWKTGFRFGPASEALYTKVAQERVVAGASSESEKRAEGRSAKEIGIDLTAAYAEFNEALRTKQSTVAAMGKATKLEQQIFVMAEDKDPNACALGAVLYFNKGNVERKAAGSNPKVARRHYVDALRLANCAMAKPDALSDIDKENMVRFQNGLPKLIATFGG